MSLPLELDNIIYEYIKELDDLNTHNTLMRNIVIELKQQFKHCDTCCSNQINYYDTCYYCYSFICSNCCDESDTCCNCEEIINENLTQSIFNTYGIPNEEPLTNTIEELLIMHEETAYSYIDELAHTYFCPRRFPYKSGS